MRNENGLAAVFFIGQIELARPPLPDNSPHASLGNWSRQWRIIASQTGRPMTKGRSWNLLRGAPSPATSGILIGQRFDDADGRP